MSHTVVVVVDVVVVVVVVLADDAVALHAKDVVTGTDIVRVANTAVTIVAWRTHVVNYRWA